MFELVVYTAIIVAIYSLLVLSLNLQYGFTGLLNFGHIALFAVGAYTVAVGHQQLWPIWVGLALAPIVGALFGVLMSVPVRRLKQEYWALMTLGVAEIFRAVMDNEEWIAGGTRGTKGIPPLAGRSVVLAVLLILVALTLLAFERVTRSQFGRVIKAIREDERLVLSLGRDIFRYQVRVMMMGGAVAAIAGAIFAHFISFVNSAPFSLTETFIIWTMLIVGGLGNNYGAIVGAILLQGVLIATRFLPNYLEVPGETYAIIRTVLIGVLLVVTIIVRPQGAVPEGRRRYRAAG